LVPKSTSVNRAFRRFLKRLEHALQPDKVILFGSRARGNHRKTSDFDLLIVSRKFRGVPWIKRAPIVIRLWDIPLDVEPICLTPEELEKRSGELSIVGEAVRHGVEVAA
jgi:predicted nucleotidyltransferase